MKQTKALRAGMGYTIGNYLARGIAFAAVPVFARLMSPEEVGLYGAFSSYESIFYMAAGLAVHLSYKNAKIRYATAYDAYISDSILLILLLFAAGAFVLVPVRARTAALLGLPVPGLFCLLVYCSGAAVLSCWYARASLSYDYRKYTAASLIYSAGSAALGILFLLGPFRGNGAVGRMAATALVIGAESLYIAVYLFRRARPARFREMMHWGIRFSVPAIPAGISQTILAESDKIMILLLADAADAGVYTLAFQVCLIGNIAVQSLEYVWTPWFYERYRTREFPLLRHGMRLCLLGMSSLYAVLILTSPLLIRIMGGRAFGNAEKCILPMLCGGYFAFLGIFPVTAAHYHEKTGRTILPSMSSACLNLALNAFCIPRFGFAAAGWTTLVSYFAYAVLSFWMVRDLPDLKELFEKKWILLSCAIVPAAAVCGNIIWNIRP